MTKVDIVERQGQAALVEHADPKRKGKRKRSVVPAKTLEGAQVSEENLAKGIPHGDLEGLTLTFPTPAEFVTELNARGVWTRCDLLANMATVRGILNEYVKVNQARLRAFAKEK